MTATMWDGKTGAWDRDYQQRLIRMAQEYRQRSTPAQLLRQAAGVPAELEPTEAEIRAEQDRLTAREGRQVSAGMARLSLWGQQGPQVIEARSARELTEAMAAQPEAVGYRDGVGMMVYADTMPEPVYSGDPRRIESIKRYNSEMCQQVYRRQAQIGKGFRFDDGRAVAGIPE